MLAFPLGDWGGGQHVHMRMLKAGTIFPSLPWLYMSYGIQLRPLKNKAVPSIFLRSLAKFSAGVTACPAFHCSSIGCLHAPSLSVTTGEKRMQASTSDDSATGVLDNGFTVGWTGERGTNRGRERAGNGVT